MVFAYSILNTTVPIGKDKLFRNEQNEVKAPVDKITTDYCLNSITKLGFYLWTICIKLDFN